MTQLLRKNVQVLVYTNAGNFLTVWKDIPEVSFIKNIDGGLGECVLQLPKKFDTAGPDLFLGNIVEIRVADKDTAAIGGAASTKIIYRGYISMMDRVAVGQHEGITVHLLGMFSLLAMDILKDGTQTTLYSDATAGLTTGTASAADIGLMARAVIDRYRAENTNPQINYTTKSTPLTGTSGTYHIAQKTYADALEALRKIAPPHTFFYVDENGTLSFRVGNATPDHIFVMGKHISSITASSNIETMRNVILVWNGLVTGAIYSHYEDVDSRQKYGRRATRINDYGIDSQAIADLMGNKFISENKDPEVKITATILDNNGDTNFGYDIESIEPGDTCSFIGFDVSLNRIFKEGMLITKVDYTLDRTIIEAEIVRTTLQDMQSRNDKNIGELGSGGKSIPNSYA